MLKTIKGYEGLYEISPTGKVFSYKSKKQLKLQLGSPIELVFLTEREKHIRKLD